MDLLSTSSLVLVIIPETVFGSTNLLAGGGSGVGNEMGEQGTRKGATTGFNKGKENNQTFLKRPIRQQH